MLQRDESGTQLPLTLTAPTQPGAYWFLGKTARWEILVEVCVKDGKLMVWLLSEAVPVTILTGRWRGPVPLSMGRARRHE
jgi:hypothetical protein